MNQLEHNWFSLNPAAGKHQMSEIWHCRLQQQLVSYSSWAPVDTGTGPSPSHGNSSAALNIFRIEGNGKWLFVSHGIWVNGLDKISVAAVQHPARQHQHFETACNSRISRTWNCYDLNGSERNQRSKGWWACPACGHCPGYVIIRPAAGLGHLLSGLHHVCVSRRANWAKVGSWAYGCWLDVPAVTWLGACPSPHFYPSISFRVWMKNI